MRHLILASWLLTLTAAPASARYVGPGTSKSWGKADVSLVEYRTDAITCGQQAAALDVGGSGPAEALVLASRMIENAPDVAAAADARRIASPERNFLKVGDMLEAELERCLTAHGYQKFKLTSEQRRRLAKLPIGS